MAKKETPDLLELIQSMTQSEKRYFKMKTSWMKGEEETQYLRLFDYLATSPAHTGKLPEFKRPDLLRAALYERLVKVLCEYHSTNDSSIGFLQQLQGYYVLKSRGLMHQAKRQLMRIEKSIDKASQVHFNILLQLNKRESMLVADTSIWTYDELESVHSEFIQSAENTIARENVMHAIWYGYKRLQDILEIKHEKEKKEIELLLQNVLQLRSMLTFPLDPGFELYIINFGIAASAVLREFSGMMQFANEALGLKGRELKFFAVNPDQSFRVISNYGYAALYNYNFPAAKLAVEQMRQMTFPTDYILENKICFNYLVIDLVCAQYGETQHEKLQQLYRECVQFLKRRSLPGFFAVNITYLLALLAYQRGDVKSAKKLLYQLVYGNPKDVNVRSVFVSSYFLYLVLLWEEEDFSSLQSQLRRCSREIKGTMDLSASEKLFFELITSTSFLKKDSKILQRKIKETHQKMDTLLRDGKDHVNPTFFSFPDWLLAVLEKKNYFQVLRHKVLKKTN